MTDARAGDAQSEFVRLDPATIATLPLPSHVSVWADGRWRHGWLIGRSHELDGWIAHVQYDNDRGQEVTAEIPAERIAAAVRRRLDD
jgi:hypothetical protein